MHEERSQGVGMWEGTWLTDLSFWSIALGACLGLLAAYKSLPNYLLTSRPCHPVSILRLPGHKFRVASLITNSPLGFRPPPVRDISKPRKKASREK